ncbi:GlsB/YeaQ/YmgE family stress response membrane protein [Tuanshanicoccus lijuaniae]|uniref:GlsB/YeaQ/YmgE family stress response membrane protein n=1 Tax=Aerococcaceae bacterium zg-1292 TaxID=2774330 RepID=UPI0019371F2B|nr:GlsB/YeaQ/YmgE family stress response membrane protein [Aerococcaceae bacterium zg-1292]MBF6624994.1 GlsB/YeaQ/YmgE family stress response membrane protein [Aerococcaceae bacterium zg-BR9]MBS4456246.1 GlsB/YeaQ/YmgE family stress response membrane protein [Aerococcaceae bacterium zg-A91]MBS4458167.1 GlsB/YeaQ/YmgE family stress response membrane protein [Aerococcaceae bacterium zg-BR33]MBF6626261.1 GlsB/YeaQ/YmgE family stress response membrane protein [Aerococcaceae bacterium zg-BR9]
MIWSLIVGGILGWLAGVILNRDIPGGIIGNIIAGFLGGWIGNQLFGPIGPVWGGFSVVSTLLGAILLIIIVSYLFKRRGR